MTIDYTLYYCTDRNLMTADTIEESVQRAIAGGCSVVQLREKDGTAKAFYDLAVRVKQITKASSVPLIINDRVDVALAVDADGVHVGQSDLPASAVRTMIGNKLLGVSVATVAEALQAVEHGADYLGVGAMFPTETKNDTRAVSEQTLRDIRKAVQVPIVVIGGIGLQNAHLFHPLGVDGIAVVSAIAAMQDETAAAKQLREVFLHGKKI